MQAVNCNQAIGILGRRIVHEHASGRITEREYVQALKNLSELKTTLEDTKLTRKALHLLNVRS